MMKNVIMVTIEVDLSESEKMQHVWMRCLQLFFNLHITQLTGRFIGKCAHWLSVRELNKINICLSVQYEAGATNQLA